MWRGGSDEVSPFSFESHLMREHIPDDLRVLPSPDLHQGSEVEGGSPYLASWTSCNLWISLITLSWRAPLWGAVKKKRNCCEEVRRMSWWGLGGLVNIPGCLAKPQSDIVLCQRNYHMFFFIFADKMWMRRWFKRNVITVIVCAAHPLVSFFDFTHVSLS